ncbi:hypothetical protein KATP_13840 [Kluyvera ascorbata]|nr:hypothetical protein KATP_13840 [Kluyvera ascorbata]
MDLLASFISPVFSLKHYRDVATYNFLRETVIRVKRIISLWVEGYIAKGTVAHGSNRKFNTDTHQAVIRQ